MKQILHLFLFGFLFVNFLYAQSDSQKCPSISIEGPSGAPRAGDKIPFKLNIGNYFDTSNLKYIWSVDNGKILSGQGTHSIIIDQSGLDITSLTATVTITGLPESCPNTYSESSVTHCGVEAVLVNEYQKITSAEENKKLDILINELRNYPAARGIIQKSFPSGQSKADIYKHLKRILDYLKSKDFDVTLITFGVIYDKNIEETKLYLIPPGADNPEIKGEILESKELLEKLTTTKLNTQIYLSCPTISVISSSSVTLPDEAFSFTADISKGYDTSNLKYVWTVSKGKIVNGQGTLKIDIAPQKNEFITATLAVQGLPANCDNIFSESYLCADCYSPRIALLRDEYNRISFNEENLRLNKFANEFENYPDAMVFIKKSFTRSVSKITAYRDLQRISDHLQSRGINSGLIIFDATFGKEERTTLFIVPPGADLPPSDDEILDAAKLAERIKTSKVKPKNKSSKQKFISH